MSHIPNNITSLVEFKAERLAHVQIKQSNNIQTTDIPRPPRLKISEVIGNQVNPPALKELGVGDKGLLDARRKFIDLQRANKKKTKVKYLLPDAQLLDDARADMRLIMHNESLCILMDNNGNILSNNIPLTPMIERNPTDILTFLILSQYVKVFEHTKDGPKHLRLTIEEHVDFVGDDLRQGYIIWDQYSRPLYFLFKRWHFTTDESGDLPPSAA